MNRNLLLALVGMFLMFVLSIAAKNFKNKTYIHSKFKYIFGIDVSHYQGIINWNQVSSSRYPIKFVFIRSTMGQNGKDKQFDRNWKKVKQYNYIRGAYHYYRPNENSTIQFENFKQTVQLEKGDLPPVLDIEEISMYGQDNLRTGILNWLKLAEEHYKVKPIIYTGRKYYQLYLQGHVDDYPLWIASYSGKNKLKGISWSFHQYSDKVKIQGIKHKVDVNDFKGKMDGLNMLRIK